MRRTLTASLITSSLIVVLCGAAADADSPPQQKQAARPLHERIDNLLQQAVAAPVSGSCTDGEFIRRLSIDLHGLLPSVAETRKFLGEKCPNKRADLIDRLLDQPRYALHLANAFDVMLLERRDTEGITHKDWERYLYDSFLANKPFDQLAKEILTADGSDPKLKPATKFYLERNGDPNLLTRDIGRIFFARDFQCCQCHDHPLIGHYHQADYYGLFAFLQRGYLTLDPTKPENKGKPVYFAEKADGGATFQSVFDPKKTKHGTRPRLPGDTEIDEPYYPVGSDYQQVSTNAPYPKPKYSRRARLANEMIATSNVAFRRNIVNRLWAHMLGQGLFEPVDLDHPDNPPTSPALVELLADEFRSMHYDIKGLLREIALTNAYQRSVDLPPDLKSVTGGSAVARQRFESEQQTLTKSVAGLAAEIKVTEASLVPLTKAAEAVGEELTKAEAKATETKKVFDSASEALTKTQTDVDARRFAAKALTEAALKTRTALARIPNEKSLANVATIFQTRATSLAAEADKLAKSLPAQTAALKTARQKLEVEQQNSQRIATKLAAAQTPLVAPARRLADLTDRRQRRLARLNSLKQAVAAVKSAESYATRRAAAQQAERSVREARQRQSLTKQLVAIRAPLIAAREDQLVLTRSLSGSVTTAEVATAIETTRTELENARQSLRDVDKQLAAAETQARTLAGAVETDLAAVSKTWSNRFAAGSLKPLSPEQLGWNLMHALGVVATQRKAVEADFRKKKIQPTPAELEWEVAQTLKSYVGRFVALYGPTAGQPQRAFFTTVDQALFLSNGGEVRSWLPPSPGNLCERLLKAKDAHAVAEELYLSVLTRSPLPDEEAEIDRYLAARPKDRPTAMQEVIWALLATSEFRFNH